MIMYKLNKPTLSQQEFVIRTTDGANIPMDEANTDYANFKKEILADEAQLQDAEGVIMADAKDYVRTLP